MPPPRLFLETGNPEQILTYRVHDFYLVKLEELIKRYGYDAVYKGGLKVYTTLDLDMQEAAERAIAEGLRNLDEKHAAGTAVGVDVEALPEDLRAAQKASALPEDLATNVVQAALVAIDPRTGEIRAPAPDAVAFFGPAAYQLPFAARSSRGFIHRFTRVSHRPTIASPTRLGS